LRRPAQIDRLKGQHSVLASFYLSFDTGYVKDKFKQLDAALAARLGKMINKRRQLLFYRSSHDRGLRKEKDEQVTFVLNSDTVEPLSPAQRNDIDLAATRQMMAKQTAPSRIASTKYTKATTFRINALLPGKSPDLYAPSVAESVSSMRSSYTDEHLKVEIPSRPRGEDGKPLDRFKCPYCMLAQFINTHREWK
jgi:hypothetical protein